jgi:hypothetical protein
VGYNYQNGGSSTNLTGSPDYGARIRVVGDPGSGCSSDPYRQFNTAAFQGPLVRTVGLESGNDYLHQCFISALDAAIARNIPHGYVHTEKRRNGGRTEKSTQNTGSIRLLAPPAC